MISKLSGAALIAATFASSAVANDLRPPTSEPEYVGDPKYVVMMVGEKLDQPMWIVFDQTGNGEAIRPYDVAYVDLNGNLDLTEKGERIDLTSAGSRIAEFVDPFSGVKHTEFSVGGPIVNPVNNDLPGELPLTLAWMNNNCHISFKYQGKYQINAGAQLANKPTEATPVAVDLESPLKISGNRSGRRFDGVLEIGGKPEKLYLGTGEKLFAVDAPKAEALPEPAGPVYSRSDWTIIHNNQFDIYPKTDYLVATLFYTNKDGQPARHVTKLKERC